MEHSTTPKILIVDDEQDVLRVAQTVLTRDGFEVILAKGTDSAISAFRRLNPKPVMLLTDVVMPGMSGPMLADQLLAETPELRVLFMSGYDETQVVRKYVVERGFKLIAKPFTPQRLSEAVKEALGTPSGILSATNGSPL